MPIEFRCTHCNKLLRTKDDSAGKQAKCPECGTRLTVPAADSAEAPPVLAPRVAASGGFSEEDLGVDNPYSAPRSSRAPSPRSPRPDAVPGDWTPTQIDIGDMFRRTWTIFQRNLGRCILMNLVFMGVLCGCALLGVLLIAASFMTASILAIGAVILFVALAIIYLALLLSAGVHHFMLKVARGEEAGLADLFTAGRWIFPLLLAGLIVQSLTGIGSILIVGGVIVLLYVWPYQFLIIDRNVGALDSISQAMRITEGNRLTIFLIGIVALIAGGLFSTLTLGLGTLIAGPYILLLFSVAYLAMTGQPTADQIEP